MSEENAGLENDFDADLEAGFSGTPTETPEQQITIEDIQQDQTQETQQEPTYRQLTEDEYSKLVSSAAEVEEIKATLGKQFDTAFGKIGGMERVLRQFQEQTPSGQAVEITAEDVEELARDYPELAESQLKVLQRVAGKMRGTGGIDDERIRQAINPSLATISEQAVLRAKMEIATETLSDTHEGWESIVGMPDQQGNVPDTEFRAWLNTQKPEYRDKVLNTYSATVIGKAIDSFREHQTKLKNDSERRSRFSDAVTPKGDGGYQHAVDDEEAAFAAGFKGR